MNNGENQTHFLFPIGMTGYNNRQWFKDSCEKGVTYVENNELLMSYFLEICQAITLYQKVNQANKEVLFSENEIKTMLKSHFHNSINIQNIKIEDIIKGISSLVEDKNFINEIIERHRGLNIDKMMISSVNIEALSSFNINLYPLMLKYNFPSIHDTHTAILNTLNFFKENYLAHFNLKSLKDNLINESENENENVALEILCTSQSDKPIDTEMFQSIFINCFIQFKALDLNLLNEKFQAHDYTQKLILYHNLNKDLTVKAAQKSYKI